MVFLVSRRPCNRIIPYYILETNTIMFIEMRLSTLFGIKSVQLLESTMITI